MNRTRTNQGPTVMWKQQAIHSRYLHGSVLHIVIRIDLYSRNYSRSNQSSTLNSSNFSRRPTITTFWRGIDLIVEFVGGAGMDCAVVVLSANIQLGSDLPCNIASIGIQIVEGIAGCGSGRTPLYFRCWYKRHERIVEEKDSCERTAHFEFSQRQVWV